MFSCMNYLSHRQTISYRFVTDVIFVLQPKYLNHQDLPLPTIVDRYLQLIGNYFTINECRMSSWLPLGFRVPSVNALYGKCLCFNLQTTRPPSGRSSNKDPSSPGGSDQPGNYIVLQVQIFVAPFRQELLGGTFRVMHEECTDLQIHREGTCRT